ncbi:MAG: family 43 glycosylhydrolase, partial [Chloroflexia bacterium]
VTIRIPGTNKVAESFADPSIIKAKDGFYYSYATSDPLYDGDRVRIIPTARSNDLVNWTYVGDAFTTRPAYARPDAGIWAPDIRYQNNRYYLYYVVTETTFPNGGSAIGVATSNNPDGPWTHSPNPVVEPHEAPCCPGSRRWTFDPAVFTDIDGQRYVYYGSYFGGLSVRKLSANGLTSDPASQRQITISNRYEGAYVIRRGEYYYLFASASNCCNFELTGYSVFAGRSRSPLGPFVDREGVALLPDPVPPYDRQGRVGGTPVISMNGNRWVGPGHNAVLTDVAGQDWFYYHAINRFNPSLPGPGFTINRRPMLLDRLDWVGGWPTVRSGYWASDFPQTTPATDGGVYNEFNRTTGIGDRWFARGGSWRIVNPIPAPTRATYARPLCSRPTRSCSQSAQVRRTTAPSSTCGCATAARTLRYVATAQSRPTVTSATISRRTSSPPRGDVFLVTNVRTGGVNSLRRSPSGREPGNAPEHRHRAPRRYSADFGHGLAAQRPIGSTDPQRYQRRPAGRPARGRADRLHDTDRESRLRQRERGEPLHARQPQPTERPAWNAASPILRRVRRELRPRERVELVRRPADTEFGFITDGGRQYLRLRTQAGDLAGGSNNAPILLENAPSGDFTVETRVRFNIPSGGCCFNFQQAGIVLYQNDDKHLRLTHVAIFETRQTEFGKEQLDEPRFGSTVVGPPRYTTYLRIVRKVNSRTGLGLYTAYTRQEGKPWIRGGTWTHRLDNLKIGLIAFRGNAGSETEYNADFDYVRVYRP